MNKVKASEGNRGAVLERYRSKSLPEFKQWIVNMYALNDYDLVISAFRFGNNHKMRETCKSIRQRWGHSRKFYQTSVVNFDMPSGYTCGMARICETYANRKTGKLNQVGDVLCFAAKMEAISPATRENAWINYAAVTGLLEAGLPTWEIAEMIDYSRLLQFPHSEYVRIHAGGDFGGNDSYFGVVNTWAMLKPAAIFGYTKYLRYVLPQEYGMIRRADNFHLVYSWGGKDDGMAHAAKQAGKQFGSNAIKTADNPCEGLPVACTPCDPGDDIFYILNEQDFCIELH